MSMEEIAADTMNMAVPARNTMFLLSTTIPVKTLVALGIAKPTTLTNRVSSRKITTSLLYIQSAIYFRRSVMRSCFCGNGL